MLVHNPMLLRSLVELRLGDHTNNECRCGFPYDPMGHDGHDPIIVTDGRIRIAASGEKAERGKDKYLVHDLNLDELPSIVKYDYIDRVMAIAERTSVTVTSRPCPRHSK